MYYVAVSSQLGCVDLSTFSCIDDTGTCYDATRDETDPNCVEVYLKEQASGQLGRWDNVGVLMSYDTLSVGETSSRPTI